MTYYGNRDYNFIIRDGYSKFRFIRNTYARSCTCYRVNVARARKIKPTVFSTKK